MFRRLAGATSKHHGEALVYLQDREKPYTADEVKTLFPVLTEVECLIVADIEQRFPGWHVWPDVEYPQAHLWYSRRNSTPMDVLAVGKIGDMPGEITNWINNNSSPAWGEYR